MRWQIVGDGPRLGDPAPDTPAVAVLGAVANYPAHADELVQGVAKRQREFRAARHFARLALADLDGDGTVAIGRDDGRRPQWPPGFVGSLTHCEDLAGAVVSRADSLAGIGLDIERTDRMREELVRMLLTDAEAAAAGAFDAEQVTLIFSAKEAVYKAINPIAGQYIGFRSAEIVFEEPGRFVARYLGDHEPSRRLESGRGYFWRSGVHVVTLFELPLL